MCVGLSYTAVIEHNFFWIDMKYCANVQINEYGPHLTADKRKNKKRKIKKTKTFHTNCNRTADFWKATASSMRRKMVNLGNVTLFSPLMSRNWFKSRHMYTDIPQAYSMNVLLVGLLELGYSNFSNHQMLLWFILIGLRSSADLYCSFEIVYSMNTFQWIVSHCVDNHRLCLTSATKIDVIEILSKNYENLFNCDCEVKSYLRCVQTSDLIYASNKS